MRFDRDKLFARKRLRAAAWLTLLSLALVQLSLATHQFDHAATDLADHCEVCVQLDRLDDSATGDPLCAISVAASYGDLALAADRVSETFRYGPYHPRDPPIS